jgi:hypothetical protein
MTEIQDTNVSQMQNDFKQKQIYSARVQTNEIKRMGTA